MDEIIPRLEDQLPDLFEFVRTAALQIEAGELRDGDALALRIRDFYTADRMDVIETVAPGWRDMSAYADGATRAHVTQAMIALQLLPEYRQASRRLQALMEWSELYHDLGKQVIRGQRDALHAFRGAAMAARALPKVGFRASDAHPAALDAWTRVVLRAAIAAPDGRGPIQDNRALPEILKGIDGLFGAGSAAALIVEAVPRDFDDALYGSLVAPTTMPVFHSTAFSADGNLLGSCNRRGTLHIWRPASFEEIARLEARTHSN